MDVWICALTRARSFNVVSLAYPDAVVEGKSCNLSFPVRAGIKPAPLSLLSLLLPLFAPLYHFVLECALGSNSEDVT